MNLPLTQLPNPDPNKVTLGWTPVPGAVGYRFQSATQAPKWSHTFDPNRNKVTFSKAAWYKVEALGVEAAGNYPPADPGDLQPEGIPGSFDLDWADEFDGSTLNQANFRWDPHCKFGFSVPDQPDSRVMEISNGTLKLKTYPEQNFCGTMKQARAGAIASFMKNNNHPQGGTPLRSFKHGYIEARIKCSRTAHFFPAFWLLGWQPHLHSWPDNGEIDILEFVRLGSDPGPKALSAWHWNGTGCTGGDCKIDWDDAYAGAYPKINTEFVRFGLYRTSNEMRIYHDGRLMRTVRLGDKAYNGTTGIPAKMFDDPMFILLTAQVCNLGDGWCEDQSKLHVASVMEVDYVRAWTFA